jgi:S-(hydroxymethyl)mycothiol dehydrogenase
MLVDLHLAGRLPLDKFVSETIGLGDVEAAFARMGRGEVLRSVVTLRATPGESGTVNQAR